MHTWMHCSYMHLTPNTLTQSFSIISLYVCNACMLALLIHSSHTIYPESWFSHHIPSHLQCMHECIADTFNLHQVTWIMDFVIIFRCVCNACMHALLIHSSYTKYPNSVVFFQNFLWCEQFMHACMHCFYIHFTKYHDWVLSIYSVVFAMHAKLMHSLFTAYHDSGVLSIYSIGFEIHAMLIHSPKNKYHVSGYSKIFCCVTLHG